MVETKNVVIVAVGIGLVPKAVVVMFPAHIYPHPIAQVVPQSRHCFRAVAIVKVAHPSSDDFIYSPNYDRGRRCTIPFSGQLLDL